MLVVLVASCLHRSFGMVPKHSACRLADVSPQRMGGPGSRLLAYALRTGPPSGVFHRYTHALSFCMTVL